MSVVVYSSDTCSPCKTLKKALNHYGIEYEEVTYYSDEARFVASVERHGYTMVPRVEKDGELVMIGWQPDKLAML